MTNRRFSSMLRYNMIHDMYKDELEKLGELAGYVSKEYIYGKIKEKTGLSVRSISFILNHTRKKAL